MIATRAALAERVHCLSDAELAHEWLIRSAHHPHSVGNLRVLRAVRLERLLRECEAGS